MLARPNQGSYTAIHIWALRPNHLNKLNGVMADARLAWVGLAVQQQLSAVIVVWVKWRESHDGGGQTYANHHGWANNSSQTFKSHTTSVWAVQETINKYWWTLVFPPVSEANVRYIRLKTYLGKLFLDILYCIGTEFYVLFLN